MKTQHDDWREAHDRTMAEMAAEMNYKLEDTRSNEHFKYLIRIGRMLEFHTVRQWMTQTYGLAEHIDRDTIHNPYWGFEIKMGSNTIYLRGNEELSWFRIKYGEPV